MPKPLKEPAQSLASDASRDLFCWALLAAAALLVALAVPLLAGRVYTRDDLAAFHLPVRAFYAEQLARGEPFDWMPQLYAGFYLTGEGQAGTYHPLHLLLYWSLPLPTALGCELLLSYPLMLIGTWLFLRRRLRRSDAAMFGSLLFTFSAFNLLHFIHPNAVAVVAHIPWLLWAIDIVVIDADRLKVALAQAGIALLTGSQLLLGYPQYVWFSLLAEAAYATFVLIDRKHAVRDGCELCATCGDCAGCTGSPWSRLVVAKGIGLLLGGVQLLPTLDALAQSARQSADASFASSGSLHPLNLLQLVAPYLFADRVLGQNTHELGLYAGAVPLALVVWLLAHPRRLGSYARLAWFGAGLGLCALLLAFGKYALLYRLQTWLPLVGHFRFPCRYVVLFHLAMAVLASIAFVLLVRQNRRSAAVPAASGGRDARVPALMLWKEFEPLWALLAVSVAVAVVGVVLQGRAYIASVPAVLAGPLLLAAAAALIVWAARGSRGALVGLVLFAAADVGCYGLSYCVGTHSARLEELVAATPTPPGAIDGRMLAAPLWSDPQGLRTGNQVTLSGWQRADGYAGLEPQRLLDYRNLSALRIAGVRWVKRTAATGEIEGLLPHDENWLEVPDPLPRARLVTQAVASDDPARDIQRIRIESAALSEVPLALPAATPGTADLVAERPGRLAIRTECRTPQLLVVSESFHPGWQATLDGSPQPVLRVNGDFLGCLVAAGEHQVVLEFRPRSLRLGWLDSGVAVGLLAVCVAGGLYRPKLQIKKDNMP